MISPYPARYDTEITDPRVSAALRWENAPDLADRAAAVAARARRAGPYVSVFATLPEPVRVEAAGCPACRFGRAGVTLCREHRATLTVVTGGAL